MVPLKTDTDRVTGAGSLSGVNACETCGAKQDWAGRASGHEADLTKAWPTQQGLWNKYLPFEEPCVGRTWPGTPSTLSCWLGRRWPGPECGLDSRGPRSGRRHFLAGRSEQHVPMAAPRGPREDVHARGRHGGQGRTSAIFPSLLPFPPVVSEFVVRSRRL